MMPRGVRHAFTLFELLLALALLAALSSLVVGVLLRTDRDHDLLQVQLEVHKILLPRWMLPRIHLRGAHIIPDEFTRDEHS